MKTDKMADADEQYIDEHGRTAENYIEFFSNLTSYEGLPSMVLDAEDFLKKDAYFREGESTLKLRLQLAARQGRMIFEGDAPLHQAQKP